MQIILALFALTWFVLVFSVTALFAPKGTPKDIVAKLNAAVIEGLADPKVRAQL